jgi:hypothetical protein
MARGRKKLHAIKVGPGDLLEHVKFLSARNAARTAKCAASTRPEAGSWVSFVPCEGDDVQGRVSF